MDGSGAVTAALVGFATDAPARAREAAAPRTGAVGEARCRCGHEADAHEHFRRGSDCGACGAARCARFRPARVRRWLPSRRG